MSFGLVDLALRKFRPDIPWMTPPEAELFKHLVANGAITIFRVGACEKCKADIPTTKKFCSKKCALTLEKKDGIEDENG
jgi:hypothetical protein